MTSLGIYMKRYNLQLHRLIFDANTIKEFLNVEKEPEYYSNIWSAGRSILRKYESLIAKYND